MSGPSQTHTRGTAERVLRIIGGTWRGRRLRFPPAPAIRPTPDRVRETLFNWLAGAVAGARCLDLFSGSGALGLEALSRGAGHVTFVEHERRSARSIEACLTEWDPQRRRSWRVVTADVHRFLACCEQPFDIAFLDPPFASGALGTVLSRLENRGWLAAGARVYVECPAESDPPVPAAWEHLRARRSGQVGYHLYERPGGSAAE